MVQDAQGALAEAKSAGDGFPQVGEPDVAGRYMENQDIDIVLLESFEAFEPLDLLPLIIDKEPAVALASGPCGHLGVEAFSSAHEGSQNVDRPFFQQRPDSVDNGVLCLWDDRFTGFRAILRAKLGVEQTQEVVDLGDGGYGRLSAALGDALFDRDRGRESRNPVDVGLFQLLGKLTSIGGHGVQEAALPFREDNVKGKGRLAASAQSRHDDELVAGNTDLDVLEIVFPGPRDLNRCAG